MSGALEGFRLSRQQERLWRLGAADPHSPLRLRFAVYLRERIAPALLLQSVQRVVSDFEVLRTRFVQPSGMMLPLQVIDEVTSTLCECDQQLGADTPGDSWRAWLGESDRFELPPPSIKLRLVTMADNRQLLLGSMPAICADAASVGAIIEDLCGEQPDGAREAAVQYADYAQWQEDIQDTAAAEQGRAFWAREENRELLELTLRDPFAPSAQSGFAPRQIEVPVSSTVAAGLEPAVKSVGVSPAAFLLGCWQLLLSVLLDSPRLMIFAADQFVPEELDGAVGPFELYLPVTVTMALDQSLPDLLQGVQRKLTLAAESREHFSIEQLLERSGRPHAPFLFSLHESTQGSAPGAQIMAVAICNELCDLKCAARIDNGRLSIQLQYDAAKFSLEYVERLAAQLAQLIERAVGSPPALARDLIRASSAEAVEQLAEGTGGGAAEAFCDMHRLFERQAALTPDAAAVWAGEHRLSYRELNEAANRLAAALRGHSLTADERIAICLARSPAAIIAILAVLKSGCAYVPLDPSYPRRRLALILAGARARILITQRALLETCGDFCGITLCLDDESQRLGEQPSANDSTDLAGPQNLAYLIYTSGSTGVPKGVMVTRAGASNSTRARLSHYSERPERFLVLPSLAFDSSVAPLFSTLCSGGCLVLIDEQAAGDPRRICETIESCAVTHLLAVPSLYKQLLDMDARALRSLRTVIVAGEACAPTLVDRHMDSLREVDLYNEYGPTEATVWSSVWHCEAQRRPRDVVPIGKAIAGAQLYVLGRDLQLLPSGAIGELYIGGAGIARGYCEQPGLTASRFIPDPHGEHPGRTLYRTGDRVRWLGSGDLQFCGRIDQQVKVRGFRIECGEIEAVLDRHPSVDSAAVAVRGESEEGAEIIAYCVQKAGVWIDRTLLRDHLGEYLPSYMMPNKFVLLAALPRSANGKVDYRSLPAPDAANSGAQQYEAPATSTERQLAEIWEAVLRRAPIGRRENFFDLGGHSLLAVQIVNRMQRSFGIAVEIGQIFRSQSLAQLAEHVDTLAHDASLAPMNEPDLEEVRL